MPVLAIRPARPEEAGVILRLLAELAAFEKLPITLTEHDIARDFFARRPPIECDLALVDGEAVGLVTCYWSYATFRAARRLFVEDLYVRPQFRGQGYGKALLRHLAAKGQSSGAARLEWQVLAWNEKAMDFYRGIGAHPHEGWQTYWLEGEAMAALAGP